MQQGPFYQSLVMCVDVCTCACQKMVFLYCRLETTSNGFSYHINLCFAVTQGGGSCAASDISAVSNQYSYNCVIGSVKKPF